jgi:serine/threonine protein kinase
MSNGSLQNYVRSPKYNAATEVLSLVCRHVQINLIMSFIDVAYQLSGIANGIAYLHALTITHGDIKHVRPITLCNVI